MVVIKYIPQNIPFEYIRPSFNTITPSGTSLSSKIKTITGTSISGSEGSFTTLGFEQVSINKLNRLDSPRIVASKVNEAGILSNEKSFALELLLSTNIEDVSPLIDLDTTNIIAISNGQ